MSGSFLARLPLSRSELDRDYLGRDDVQPILDDPAARFIVLRDGLALLDGEAELAHLTRDAAPENATAVYLGRTDVPWFALVLQPETTWEGEWGNLRRIGSRLGELDAGLFTQALAVSNWHASHAFSPVTGAPTAPVKGGWVLLDSSDGRELYPRTDMAVIVGVVDADERLLLGSNAAWEANRYSLLAGFVEPGESLEAAVAREVFEESGVRVSDPVYLGSQPWPFPASLMLGFMATATTSELTPDGLEILDLRWFSRDELRDALPTLLLPGPTSIARAIIEEWYGGPLEDQP